MREIANCRRGADSQSNAAYFFSKAMFCVCCMPIKPATGQIAHSESGQAPYGEASLRSEVIPARLSPLIAASRALDPIVKHRGISARLRRSEERRVGKECR